MTRMMIYLVVVMACHLELNVSADNLDSATGDNPMQIIDKFGNEVVLPIELREITGFSKEGISPVRLQNGETAVIDTSGKLLFKTGRDGLTVFENGMSVFQDPITYLWGVYTSKGERIVKAEYNWLSSYCDGYAVAYKKSSGLFVLDRDGRIVAEIKKNSVAHDYLPPCEKLIPFRDIQTNLRGFIDFESKIVVLAKFVEVGPFRERLARVLVRAGKGFKVGFINTEGAFKIEPRYPIDSELFRETTDFSEGIAFVPSITSLYDIKVAINTKGEEIFKVSALSIEPMVDGRAAFVDHVQGWGYLDSKGNVVIPPIYDRASNFGGGLAVVSKNRGTEQKED